MVTVEGEYTFPSGREQLFEALTDPATFERAIDACDRVEPNADGSYRAFVTVNALGVRNRQEVTVSMPDRQPPEALVLVLDATTPAGAVQTTLHIHLSTNGDGTRMTYRTAMVLSGVLASLGPRLVEVTAKRIIAEFLSRLDAQVQA